MATVEQAVRVLRVVEYVGPRSEVERIVSMSIHGERVCNGVSIRAATIGGFPEILNQCVGVETGTYTPEEP